MQPSSSASVLQEPPQEGAVKRAPHAGAAPVNIYLARQEHIRRSILARYPRDKTTKIALLEKAFADAAHHHGGQVRKSGEPYILHPLRVALMASEAGLDVETVIIALLHDVIEDTEMTKAEVQARYGDWLADVVDGLTKAQQLPGQPRSGRQGVATYRKLIHSTLKDLRTVQVKLFDRLDNMRDLGFLDRARQRRIGEETLNLYVPMAQRLGMQDISDELMALCFRYLYPRRFARTLRLLKERIAEEAPKVVSIRLLLESVLAQEKVEGAQVKPRHLLISDFIRGDRRMPRALQGFQVIVPRDADCYRAMGALHMKCRVAPTSIKDYISNPQPNRYRALQSQVFVGAEPINLVICSAAMDSINRSGILVKWEGSQDDLRRYYQSYLELLDQYVDSNELRMEDVLRHAQLETLQMFTPRGKLLSLPQGATVLDFAFAIHSDLGLHCAGAIMGGRRVLPFDELQDGQVVEVLQDPAVLPTPQWLEQVRTTRAQLLLRRFLKGQAHARAQELGTTLFAMEVERLGLDAQELAIQPEFQRALQAHNLTLPQFHQQVGMRWITARKFLADNGLVPQKSVAKLESQEQGLVRRYLKPMFTSPQPLLKIPQGGDAFITLSPCCLPLPGDAVIGVQTQQGVAVHRVGCPQLDQASADALTHVAWDTGTAKAPYTLHLRLVDKAGMIYRVGKVMNDLHVSIHDLVFERQPQSRLALLQVLLEPITPKTYQKIISRLRSIKEIESIGQAPLLQRERPAPGRPDPRRG